MAKPARKTVKKTEKKLPRRKSQGNGDDTSKGKDRVAYLIENGTAEQMREAFASKVPDWSDWPESKKAEAVRLMQAYWQHPTSPDARLSDKPGGGKAIGLKGDVTLGILQLCEAFSSGSDALVNERIGQIANYHGSNVSEQQVSAALAFVRGGNAQDPVQATLLTQMNATHDAAMKALRLSTSATQLDQMSALGNLSTKLLNTYARQAETLAKLQRGAEQTVRHVYVDARTQTAITCPPGHPKVEEQSYGQDGSGAFGPAMLGYDPAWNGVPVSSDEGPEALPDTRGKSRRAEGE